MFTTVTRLGWRLVFITLIALLVAPDVPVIQAQDPDDGYQEALERIEEAKATEAPALV